MAHFQTGATTFQFARERMNTARQCEHDVCIFFLFHPAIVVGWAECTVNTKRD